MSAGAFGEIRSLVQEAPSARAWARLCALLDERADEVTLGYVADHIERWPDAMRGMPPVWLERAVRGEEDARFVLARGVRCVGLSPREIELALRHPGLAALKWLSVEGGRAGDARAVAAAAPTGLERLRMSGCGIVDAGARELSRSLRLRGLEALELPGNRIGLEGARSLSRWEGELEELDLSGNPLGARAARVLAAGSFGRLSRLDLDEWRLSTGAFEALATSATLGEVARGRWVEAWTRARAGQ